MVHGRMDPENSLTARPLGSASHLAAGNGQLFSAKATGAMMPGRSWLIHAEKVWRKSFERHSL
jgi:hypothetical protein